MPDTPPQRNYAIRRAVLVLVAILAGTAAAWLANPRAGGSSRRAGVDSPCASALATARRIAPLATGEVAALATATKPLRIPDLAFADSTGQPRRLSDWKGRTVLLNLWATWCVPCRKEMPALDGLQGKLGSDRFAVVAVNIDTRDPDKPRKFLNDNHLTQLGFFSDGQARIFQDLKSNGLALGMPTSVLIDGEGCKIADIAGPAEWDSADAIKLITAATTP